MDRILIVTAHTGYNYGTYLQAYAMKCFLKNFVPEVDIVWQKTYGPNGRDYRFEKIVKLCIRTLFNYKQAKKNKTRISKKF